MAETNHCPTCECELPPDAPAGLCPACLLKAGMTSDHVEPGTKSGSKSFTPPTPTELAPYFPQLEILELIGQGGMGAVYKAKQIRLDRMVALKVLPKDAERGQEFADRFTREAKAMARLSHPNIIAIHDYGEAGGWFYFVMEFVDGVNMRQAMKAESIKPADALAIVMQICDALQYAHEESIVHRDIKPENILLTRKGKVKIADFGLAKLLGMSALDRHLTATQQVMGTIGYMAPEQMEGSKAIDHRADIYALGVVFYELLTGELPMGRFAPPSQRVQIDVRLDEVVLKSMEREPSRRYQSASQIKHEVERISAGPAVAAPTTNREVSSRDWQLIRLAVFGVAMLVFAITEFALGVANTVNFFDSTRINITDRGPGVLAQHFGQILVMIDYLSLSPLVFCAGVSVLSRTFRLVALIGTVAAMLPLGAIGTLFMVRPIPSDQFDVMQFVSVIAVGLGAWGLVELNRPGVPELFRWPVLPMLATVWRFLYPRVLNSTLLTTVACAFALAVMMGAPWSVRSQPDGLGSAAGHLRVTDESLYFAAEGEGVFAVSLTASTIIFLVATWPYTFKPVAWRPIITLLGGLFVLYFGIHYAARPTHPMQRVVFEVGLYAAFWAGGILCLNGAWRLSRWFARERQEPQPVQASATSSSEVAARSATVRHNGFRFIPKTLESWGIIVCVLSCALIWPFYYEPLKALGFSPKWFWSQIGLWLMMAPSILTGLILIVAGPLMGHSAYLGLIMFLGGLSQLAVTLWIEPDAPNYTNTWCHLILGTCLGLLGAWRLRLWFARERPVVSSEQNTDASREQTAASILPRLKPWLEIAVGLIFFLVSVFVAYQTGWIGTPQNKNRQSSLLKSNPPIQDHIQSGNFVITAGQEGWVYFPETFDRPPNVELTNFGFSKTHIAQCTEKGFQWKNADKAEDVLWSNMTITWTARAKKAQ